MNHQWTINLHDGHHPFYALMPRELIPPSLLLPCNLLSDMFHPGVDYLRPTKEPQHDLPSLAPPKGEMTSSLSWTCLFKSPTPRTLCLGDPTLAKGNQVISVSMCETEFMPPSPFLLLTLVFILEPHFCSHPGKNLTKLPPRSSFPNLF